MPDRKLFYEDPDLFRARVEVVETGTLDGRPWARLDATPFYPEGGGQPADRGTLSGVAVTDVRTVEGRILHFLESPIGPGEADAVLDEARRRDHRQQHTAQHLLTAILLSRHGRPTTAFHLGEAYTAVEIPGPPPSREELDRWEDEVNQEIRRARPVRTRWVDAEDLERLGVRSRGLPEGHHGAVRLVEIEGIDLNTCGGTHAAHLGELQMVRLIDADPARGGTRVRFIAGGRVLAAIRREAALARELNARIGTSSAEFPAVLDGWIAERRRLERRVKDLESALASRLADEWLRDGASRVARVVPGAGPEFLKALAGAILEQRPDAVVALAGGEAEACYLVQSGPAGPEDVGEVGERVRERLGAKGGGRGRVRQGRGGTLPATLDGVF